MKEKHFAECSNILHIGGHKGQEAPIYANMGLRFTFVEPIPEFAQIMRNKGYHVIEKAVSGKEGIIEFNIASVSERSSIRIAPEEVMTVERTIPVRCTTLGKIQNGYDGLSIDAQGETLEILKSGNLDFNVVICEVSKKPRYEGEGSRALVEELMIANDYQLVEEYKHKKLDIFDLVWKKKTEKLQP